MINPDSIWRQIKAQEGKDKGLVDDLSIALVENIELSQLFTILKNVKLLTKEDKTIRILDYGCGGGQFIVPQQIKTTI